MERKQGFFSALKEEVARGLTPLRSRSWLRSRSESPCLGASSAAALLLGRRWMNHRHLPPPLVEPHFNGMTPMSGGMPLPPLKEGPEPGGGDGRREGWGQWVRHHLSRSSSSALSDARLILSVMGAPLGPVSVGPADPFRPLSIKAAPIETSSAQYILQQYIAATGGLKLLSSMKNSYTMGMVRMAASEFETATKIVKKHHASRGLESGSFVLWQMSPDMWYVELVVGKCKVHAGCNSKLVWCHTPWLGTHSPGGPVRPLRRVLQGLDPLTTARVFADAHCIGEKKVNGEDCFILKIQADPQRLKARSEDPIEIIRHIMYGCFSMKTGLLVHLEDSHLTHVQATAGGDAVYWETTISTFLDDYHLVDGRLIAHSGRSIFTLYMFGDVPMNYTKTRMEETWTIEEVAFDVHGLSMDCFIPPADLKSGLVSKEGPGLSPGRVPGVTEK